MNIGKTVRLFLTDGTPGGLVTAEIMNWTGHVIAGPRSDLAALLDRSEAGRTGIYVLLGDDPGAVGGVRAYIGEADDVATRLRIHGRTEGSGGKDFWDRVVILTSKDANLTKAHVRYLEARFIELAHGANRVELANGTAPPLLPLPEADVSDMEYYIEQARIVLPVLGINVLRGKTVDRSTSTPPNGKTPLSSPDFIFRINKHGIAATARQVDGEFTVLAGSTARDAWKGSGQGYRDLHAKLIEDGSLRLRGASAEFTRDVVFNSPSAAGAVVCGRSCNGRTEWQTADGTSFGAWEGRGLTEDTTPHG